MEQGYYIERRTTGSFNIIDTVLQNTEAFIDNGLNYETQYYYRIRAFNETDSSAYSKILSTTTLSETGLPLQASNPIPANNLEFVSTSTILSWKKGIGATSHNLYFGIDSSPAFVDSLSETSYQAEGLLPGCLYFWRVDEVNEYGTTEGEIWRFTTRPALADKLVGYWQFESSTAAFDSSGFDNHGVYVNIVPGSFTWNGAVGRALNFNGVDQYVRIPNSYEFDFESGDFSVAFWMKQDTSQVDINKEYRYIIKGSHIENSELNRSGKRYEVYYKPSYHAVRFAIDDNITKSRVEADEEIFIKGEWVHVVAIRDTKSKQLSIHANGKLIALDEDNTTNISQDEDLYLGYSVDNDSYLDGALDDVRLYNYILSDNEIDSLYKLGIPSKNIPVYSDNSNLSIYPNPAVDVLYLKYSIKNNNDIYVNIYSLSGKIIRSIEMNNQPASGVMKIAVDDLVPGIYFIRFITDRNIKTEKICINH